MRSDKSRARWARHRTRARRLQRLLKRVDHAPEPVYVEGVYALARERCPFWASDDAWYDALAQAAVDYVPPTPDELAERERQRMKIEASISFLDGVSAAMRQDTALSRKRDEA